MNAADRDRRAADSMIATIDFEMTALSYEADMIEAGIALWRQDGPIRTWSSLVRPRPDCLWSEESAKIHRIARHELEEAPDPAVVAARLNELLVETEIVYCDGLPYDQVWMRGLFWSADLKPTFRLADIWQMPGLDVASQMRRMRRWLDEVTLTQHRAGPDAADLLRAYAYALGYEPQVVTVA